MGFEHPLKKLPCSTEPHEIPWRKGPSNKARKGFYTGFIDRANLIHKWAEPVILSEDGIDKLTEVDEMLNIFFLFKAS